MGGILHSINLQEEEHQRNTAAQVHSDGCEVIKELLTYSEDFGNIESGENHSCEPYKKTISEEDLVVLKDARNILVDLTLPF
jgi:hypothetical protein